jgi:hypothetical protein
MHRSMNDRLLMACVLTFVACGGPPEPGLTPVAAAASDASVPFVEVVFPATVETRVQETVSAQLDAGTAIVSTQRDFALGEEYPASVVLAPTGGTFVNCPQTRPVATWKAIRSISGDAASVALESFGSLRVTLVREGTVTVVLEGDVSGVRCIVDGGETNTVPLLHTMTLRVQRVAGFVVEHPSRFRDGCAGERLVMPIGADVAVPTALPLDGAGRKFLAANAPTAASLTLRTQRDVTVTGNAWRLSRPGQVEVSLATRLPVQGVKAFEVVGPESVRSVDAALYLTLEAAKGSFSQRVEDGGSYRVFFPTGENTIELRVSSATTTAGPLCSQVPAGWLLATSSTPEQCRAVSPSPGYAGGTHVASLVDAGACGLDVVLTGTGFHWAAAFSTTR